MEPTMSNLSHVALRIIATTYSSFFSQAVAAAAGLKIESEPGRQEPANARQVNFSKLN
jgi:hypothetical protein